MRTSLCWEDLKIGMEIPPLIKKPSTEQLVRWTGAAGDISPIHFDKDLARSMGFSHVIVQGRLKSVWFGQLLDSWIGREGRIHKFGARFHSPDYPNETLTCKGIITNKYVESNRGYVECELWIENSSGNITTTGNAVVMLPLKQA